MKKFNMTIFTRINFPHQKVIIMINYERYQFSPNHGFCPDTEPLSCIPGLEAHSSLLRSISTFTPSLIEKLPMLTEIDSLSLPELECAFTIHSMLNSVYYWHSAEPNTTIPANLAIPTLRLSRILQRPPIMNQVSVQYHNWRYIDPDCAFHPDNLELIFSFSGTRDESHFFNYANYIEALGVPAIESIYQIPEFFEDKLMLKESLKKIHESINEMTKALAEQAQRINPMVFYFGFRKYLKSFDQGVTFEGENAQYGFLNGASAAQTPLIKIIDAFLGIEHKSDLTKKTEKCLKEQHRELLKEIRKRDNKKVIEAVCEHKCTKEWNSIIQELCAFRSEHIKTAEKFILAASGKKDGTGTGGSNLAVFLENIRKNCEAAML